MATDYVSGGVTFEIDVTGAALQGATDKDGNQIFLYIVSVRRKKPQGQAQDPYKQIMDVGGKRPHVSSTADRALDIGKEFIDNNAAAIP